MVEELLREKACTIQSFSQFDAQMLALNKLSPTSIQFQIIGQPIPMQHIVLDEKKARQTVEQAIRTHWQSMNLFTFQDIADSVNNIEWMNDRLQHLFNSPNSMSKLFHYLTTNQRMTYAQFLSIVLEKEISFTDKSNGLIEVVMIKVGEQYIVQTIFTEHQVFYEILLIKKIFSAFVLLPIEQIHQSNAVLALWKKYLQKHCTNNRVASIIHQLVMHIDYENRKSFELKQAHLFNILTHASSGRRSLKRLKKCVEQFEQEFSKGEYPITQKETALLHYLLFLRAIHLNLSEEKLMYAKILVKQDNLNEYAVEIFFDIEPLFKCIRPNSAALVKHYPSYYLEFVYFHILQTFVEEGLFEESLSLLQQEEFASCTAIFEVLNGNHSEEALAKIEATVQRDLTDVYGLPAARMMEAIDRWRIDYKKRSTKSYEIAQFTVRHTMNILKTLFVTEQLDCFEKLLEVYKKYLNITSASAHLHEFLLRQIDEKSSQLIIESK